MSTFLLPAQTLAFPANPSSSLVRRSSTLASTIGVIKASSAPRSKPVLPAPLEASRFPLRGILLASIVGFACALTFNSAVTATIYPCEDVDRYYTGVDGLQGAALMKKLNSIVSAHQSLRYKDIWYALKILDAADFENPEASSEIVEIYSLRAVPKSLAGKSEGWNREHLWPRSYGLTNGPMLTDLHNIHPADANVNSSRGNKYYGECVATSAHCSRPANNEAAADTETDKERWAPPKEVLITF
ncbi:hypothetical protein ZIOFF_042222 [Zingiber officinale]|uniref:Uncharacterized protein n=1 Tax=Zingiber officinale TaxID=94328 RepID=A0A8J5L6K1_ZINOF|nr:hypothetical protein ZIOFF_042222 [Zingiber officinale]